MRLNNTIRQEVAETLVSIKFKPILEELKRERRFFTNWMYSVAVDKDIVAKVKELPEEWRGSHSRIRLDDCIDSVFYYQYRYNNHEVNVIQQLMDLKINEFEHQGISPPKGRGTLYVAYEGEVKEKADEFGAKIESAIEDAKKLYDSSLSALAQFTTRNKAIAAWPEMEVFLPEPAVKNRAVVDVTKIREINSMLGLNQVSSAQGA